MAGCDQQFAKVPSKAVTWILNSVEYHFPDKLPAVSCSIFGFLSGFLIPKGCNLELGSSQVLRILWIPRSAPTTWFCGVSNTKAPPETCSLPVVIETKQNRTMNPVSSSYPNGDQSSHLPFWKGRWEGYLTTRLCSACKAQLVVLDLGSFGGSDYKSSRTLSNLVHKIKVKLQLSTIDS